VCFDYLYNFYPKQFTFYKEFGELLSKIYIDLHVKHILFLSDFN